MIYQRIVAPVVLLLTLVGCTPEPPPTRVVVSIPPLHSLVAAVMAGVEEPLLLYRGSVSPHQELLRPSAVRSLSGARLLFWMGSEVETGLAKWLTASAPGLRSIELAEVPELIRLPTRFAGLWSSADQVPDYAHNHAEERIDPHLWLDPRNAQRWLPLITRELSKLLPDHAARLQRNSARVAEQLAVLDRELEQRLATVGDRPYLVFHDAYQYFEARYALRSLGAVSIGSARLPGARRLREIQQLINAVQVVCLFTEPQFESRLLRSIVAGTAVRSGTLDPLGSSLEAGPKLYYQLLQQLGAELVRCLGQSDETG